LFQGVLYHFVAFGLYLSASVTLMVNVDKSPIKGYKDGYYYEPFMAAGVRKGTLFLLLSNECTIGRSPLSTHMYRF
jgi:hypothetical protein